MRVIDGVSTADNAAAQRLYDGMGARKSTWLTYEFEA